jgi:membrane protease YdiL (CAAX protease family)
MPVRAEFGREPGQTRLSYYTHDTMEEQKSFETGIGGKDSGPRAPGAESQTPWNPNTGGTEAANTPAADAQRGDAGTPAIPPSANASTDNAPAPVYAAGDVTSEVVAGPGPIPVTPVRSGIGTFLRTIFLGPNGIRAGWRLLIYFVLLAGLTLGVQRTLVVIFGLPTRGQQPPPKQLIFFELCAFLVAAIASLIMATIEKQKWGHYGLPLRRAFGRDFWFGCLWGFVGLSCVLGVLHVAGAYDIDGLALHGEGILKWGLLWGAMFLLVGLFEEFLIRGYLLYALASGIWFWPAAVLTSSLFLFAHIRNPGENWYGLADVFVIGMFFCFTLWRTGSLWFAVGSHAAWDWGQSYFYSVPDSGTISPGHLFAMHMHGPAWLSGGSVGPEGSLVSLVTHVLFFVVFAALYRQRRWVGMTERRKQEAIAVQ